MREFKFRAWDIEKQTMYYYVDLMRHQYCDGGLWYSELSYAVGGDMRGMEFGGEPKFVAEQFTGIKDKDEIGVYEGDIIKVEGHPFGTAFNGNFAVTWNDHDLTWSAGGFHLTEFKPYMTVVGNIHENQALLWGLSNEIRKIL